MASTRPRTKTKRGGSQTNASDAVDDVRLPSDPTVDQVIDEGSKESFPASDPVAATQPGDSGAGDAGEPARQQPWPPRSPDWLLDKK